MVLCLGGASVAGLAAEPMLGQVPVRYAQHLEAQLTPLEDILALKGGAAADGDSGVILLDERLVSVDEEGRSVLVWHFAYKTITEGGIRSNGEEVFSYRKGEQRIALMLAETIQPDGMRQPVQRNAVLVQSPQRQAEYSLYDDQEEMRVIFPNVRPGSITHGVVVIEDVVARIPGQVRQSFGWGSSWGVELMRFLLELPPSLAKRTKIVNLGAGVPAPATSNLPDGRVRHVWTQQSLKGTPYEVNAPPTSQAGPQVKLTSFGSWDEIGGWFASLIDGRDRPGPELEAQVRRWTEGAQGREEIIARIHAGVADDVRYVGLELGTADYQPHDCNQVWANRYGDCKDKATLMVAALRQCGIEAGFAFLNTRHQGLIDRRAPDYRVFDHVIVAIPDGESYLYCDPTIGQSLPGQIATGDGGREVLLVVGSKIAWARTPVTDSGQISHAFDLKMSATGELTGWYESVGEGLNSASLRDYYGRMEPADLRRALSSRLRTFYPGADVIDAEVLKSPRGAPFRLRAYFSVAGAAPEPGQAPALRFPASDGLLPGVGHAAERRSSFYMEREKARLSVRMTLPPGWRSDQPPAALRIDAPVIALQAEWKTGGDTVVGELQVDQRMSLVGRDEFPRLYQAVQSLRAWLDRPISLGQGQPTVAEESIVAELDLPLMPTVDGQLDLVDRRFPESGDTTLRRRALERVMQYYPGDASALFRAGGRLAILDWKADRNEAAHERLAALLLKHGDQVSADIRAWGEIYAGLALRDMKNPAEALVRFQRVARDPQLAPFRRADAAPYAADILKETDKAAARAILREVCALPGGATAPVQGRLVQLLLEDDLTEELSLHLRRLVEERPDTCEQELVAILGQARHWRTAQAARWQAGLVAVISELRPQAGSTLKEELRDRRAQADAGLLQLRVKAGLEAAMFAQLLPGEPVSADISAVTREIDRLVGQQDALPALQLALGSLRDHELGADFPRRLWQAANYAEWLLRQDASKLDEIVLTQIFDWCAELPPENDYYVEGELLRATRLARVDNRQGEIRVLQALRDHPEVSSGFHLHLDLRLAAAWEILGNYAEALARYRQTESHVANEARAANGVLRAIFLRLHQGDDAEALRLIAVLQGIPDATLNKAAAPHHIRELRLLADSGRAAEAWAAGRVWWSDWLAFAEPLGATDKDLAIVIPVIEDLEQLGTKLGEATRAKDRTAYFQQFNILTSAARWLPSLGSELGSLYVTTAEMEGSRAVPLRTLLLRQLTTPHPPGLENHADRLLQQAIHFIDGGRPAEALRATAEFRRDHPADHAYALAMSRLRGLAALGAKQETEEAAAALIADLKSDTYPSQRAIAVRILSDLLAFLGREEEEEALLSREVRHPVVIADKARHEALNARLARIVGERDYAREINAWLRALDVPWLDHVGPADLHDPRLRNLEAALAAAQQHFSPAEQAKLHMLAATDLRRPRPDRERSVRLLFNQLLHLSPTYARFNEVVSRTVDHSGLDENTRITAVWVALIVLADEGRTEDYRRWRAHAHCERFNETTRKNLSRLDRWIEIDRRSPAAILGLTDEFTQDGLDEFSNQMLGDLFNALVRTGDDSALDAFVEKSANWRLPLDASYTAAALKLEFARRARQAKAVGRIFDRMAALALARYPATGEGLPAAYTDLRQRPELAQSTPDETRQACLHLLRERLANRSSLDVFGAFLSTLVREPDAVQQIDEMFSAAMAEAETDALRQEVLQEFVSHVDADNPAVRDALRRTIAREINPLQHPTAALFAALFESKVADRLGDAVKAETLLQGFSDPMGAAFRQMVGMEMQTRRGDVQALRRTVESMPAQLLLAPTSLPISIAAFEKLGMNEELKAAKEQAREEARKAVALSWASHDSASLNQALILAEILEEPELLPAAWADYVGRVLPSPFEREKVRVVRAALLADWPTVREAASVLNRDYPTHYHYYWHRAKAAAELGRKGDAKEALAVYLKYSKDEKQYPAALALAKKLGLKIRK